MTTNEEQSVGVECGGNWTSFCNIIFNCWLSLFSVCKTIEVVVEMATTAAHNSFSPLVFKSLLQSFQIAN